MSNQYYLDKDKMVDVRVDDRGHGQLYVSIYNDRNDACVGYACSKEELRGLADFFYSMVGLPKWTHAVAITGPDTIVDSWGEKK